MSLSEKIADLKQNETLTFQRRQNTGLFFTLEGETPNGERYAIEFGFDDRCLKDSNLDLVELELDRAICLLRKQINGITA